MEHQDRTIGCIEQVSFPELGVFDVLAKIDTGAYSGALHCSGIEVVRRRSNGQIRRVLRYTPLGKMKLATETDDFMETYVRSATGHRMKRFIVSTVVQIDGERYDIRIGLSDRAKMKLPVLIGRRFLRDNNVIVDVRMNQQLDDDGEYTR